MKSESDLAQQFILEQLQADAHIQRVTEGRIIAPDLEADEDADELTDPAARGEEA